METRRVSEDGCRQVLAHASGFHRVMPPTQVYSCRMKDHSLSARAAREVGLWMLAQTESLWLIAIAALRQLHMWSRVS